jgi:FMN phosphatase YigB (HAD superfamily)
VDVLRDTHRALVPGGDLLDFHPTFPPWARIEAGGEILGDLEEPSFPEQLQATEEGMREVVRRGLFRPAAEQTHELREHYDDADELIDVWQDEIQPDLERRVRAVRGRLEVVDKLVFRLYRAA